MAPSLLQADTIIMTMAIIHINVIRTRCKVAERTLRVVPPDVAPQDDAPSGAVEAGRVPHAVEAAAVGVGTTEVARHATGSPVMGKNTRVLQERRVRKADDSTALATTGGTTVPGVTTRMMVSTRKEVKVKNSSREREAGVEASTAAAASAGGRTSQRRTDRSRETRKRRPAEMAALMPHLHQPSRSLSQHLPRRPQLSHHLPATARRLCRHCDHCNHAGRLYGDNNTLPSLL